MRFDVGNGHEWPVNCLGGEASGLGWVWKREHGSLS